MKIKYFILLLILNIGCTTPVVMELEDIKPEITVNCLFTENQYFNVKINDTKIIAKDIQYQPVENASVFVKAIKKNIVKELKYQGDGNYFDSTFFPEYNEKYELTVEVPGFEIMTAIDSLPPRPVVTDINCLITNQIPREYNSQYRIVQNLITIVDDVVKSNYYEILAAGYYSEKDKYIGEVLRSDEPIIENEHANKFIEGTLIFSDEMFNGDEVKLLFNQLSLMPDNNNWHSRISVISLSEKLYQYRKLLRRQQASSYDIVYPVEPIIMDTGVDNAYGIFAGYVATEFMVYPEN